MTQLKKLLKKAGEDGKITAQEIEKIQKKTGYTPESLITRAEKADIKVAPSAQNFVQSFAQQQTVAQEQRAQQSAPAGTTASFSYSPAGTISSVTYTPFVDTTTPTTNTNNSTNPNTTQVPVATYDAANRLAELGVQERISSYGWDAQQAMEDVRQAGATERQKLINENMLAVTDKEVKGKLDLQAIVNSGYKNIANVERGSDMFRSIMSAFNF